MNKTKPIFLVIIIAITSLFSCQPQPQHDFKVLVFSKTAGFRHNSISNGRKAIKKLGIENDFQVDATEKASFFKQKNLKNYQVVIFLNTTGDVLNEAQQLEFQRYIQAGGNFVGVHAAADTEPDWDWYGDLVGGYFKSHPKIQKASIDVLNSEHPSTQHLSKKWETTDEWYNYFNLSDQVQVLMNLNESSYEGGENGANHPIAWTQEFSGGRAFYTGLGHTKEQYENETFLKHLLGGILWAGGDKKLPNYTLSSVAPEENRFKKVVLDRHFYEPMELEILPDESVLFIERGGIVKRYDPKKDKSSEIFKLDVFYNIEEGLMGMALDPKFGDNHWVYLFYSDPVDTVQHLARFTMSNDFTTIDPNSEKILLNIKTQRKECCHSGGSIEFDSQGNLYLSTGDNTNPFASQGFSPTDERAGRAPWDAQRSSANSNDLRGKVLRITPKPDGTYSIPTDNLFADAKDGRPEIYTMGCRNPFRISVDPHTGFLYWGDVGPDASQDSTHRGSRGYDEINQARKAGFFGWPLFIGNNQPYQKFDFTTRKKHFLHDPKNPNNNSVNNTGLQNLPPAQPAFIWYPYAKSSEFPLVKSGGRNAMAGPVYYQNDHEKNPRRFPKYFDKKLFIYDWMRGWIMTISMNENGDFERMERFMPSHLFDNPVDMKFSSKGDLYVLEYGKAWKSKNRDARLVRIEYTNKNRQPIAQLEANKTIGGLPMTIRFDAQKSMDSDGDNLKYIWSINDKVIKNSADTLIHTFEKAGFYTVKLTAIDPTNLKDEAFIKVTVGNEIADIQWNFTGNQTFFWKNQPLKYAVNVTDKEDGTLGEGIDNKAVKVNISYLPEGKDFVQNALGHQVEPTGKALMDKSDCKACHQLDKKSSGPTYQAIAEKYAKNTKAVNYLTMKIINGGSGVWGEVSMAAHPDFKESDARKMARYILSLKTVKKTAIPISGSYRFDQHQASENDGKYILTAIYKDKGANKIPSFSAEKMHILRQPVLTATDFDELKKAKPATMKVVLKDGKGLKEELKIINGSHEGSILFRQLDLTNIKKLDLVTRTRRNNFVGGTYEIRLDQPDGQLWASTTRQPSKDLEQHSILKVKPITGLHDIFIVFKSNDPASQKSVGTFIRLHFLN